MVNEVLLYIVLILFLLFCGLSLSPISSFTVGIMLIGVMVTAITYNICLVLYFSVLSLKLVLTRCQHRRARAARLRELKKQFLL